MIGKLYKDELVKVDFSLHSTSINWMCCSRQKALPSSESIAAGVAQRAKAFSLCMAETIFLPVITGAL